MDRRQIKQTVCVAGLAAVVAVGAGCRANKLALLSDRNVIPPPYASPQAAPNAGAHPGYAQPPQAAMMASFNRAAGDEQPALPEGNADPVFVAVDGQAVPVAPQSFDTPEDLSPKTAPAAKKGATESKPKRTYTVAAGDTLSDIGYMYQVSWQDIAAENNLTPNSVLKVGQKLKLPENAAQSPRPRQQRKPKAVKAPAPKADAKGGQKAAANGGAPAPKANAAPGAPLPADGIYTVVAGDNLWLIAKRFNLHSADIKAANPNVNFDNLQINTKIRLPKPGAPVAAPAAAPAVKKAPAAPAPLPPSKIPPAPVAPAGVPAAPVPPAVGAPRAVVPPAPPKPAPYQASPAPIPAPVQAPAPTPQTVPVVPTTPEIPALQPQPVLQPNTPLVPAN